MLGWERSQIFDHDLGFQKLVEKIRPKLFGCLIGCALFLKFFGHNSLLIDQSELSAMMPSFSKLNNVYLCLWAIFEKYNSHVIVTKTIYFVRYCNKRNSTENWLEAKVNVVQIQKTWYPRTQLTEIYQHRVVPQKFWKKGAPYSGPQRKSNVPNFNNFGIKMIVLRNAFKLNWLHCPIH